MTEISWFETNSTDALAAASQDGTVHMFPSKIHAASIAILDPILTPESLEELDILIIIGTITEEVLHHLFCEYIGIDTTEHQDDGYFFQFRNSPMYSITGTVTALPRHL